MSSIVLAGDTSGAITLAAPAVSGTNTATLPAATGTVMVSGNMPAFSAYQSTLQSTGSGAFTKVQFQTKEFDTANCYDNATNYRFTPTTAGYYQVSSGIALAVSATGLVLISIYKNGSEFKRGNVIGNNAAGVLAVVGSLIYCNGSTDYLEIYSYQSSGIALNTVAQQVQTYFQSAMVRAA